MNQLQKTIGGILIAGLLTTGVGGAAFASDTTSAETNLQQHKMGRGGDFLSVETLQSKISQLPTEQQTEILALAEQLHAYQPEKPEKHPDATDRQDSFAQIKEIFTQAGVSLPDWMDKKERPTFTNDTEKPEQTADADGEKPDLHERFADFNSERPEKSSDGTKENPFITTINTYLSQLDEANQATVTTLLEQLQTEQAERLAERQSAFDDETRETVKNLRQQLMQLLDDNNITMERPAMSEKTTAPEKITTEEKTTTEEV